MTRENDKRVSPDKETQLYTPPLVIVDIILVWKENQQCKCISQQKDKSCDNLTGRCITVNFQR